MANSRQDQLLKSLGIGVWGWDELLRCIDDRFRWYPGREQAEAFPACQSDGWMERFFALLCSAFQHRHYRPPAYLKLGSTSVSPRNWVLVPTADGRFLQGSETFLVQDREDQALDKRCRLTCLCL
jgi:hypothetical protein